MENTANFTAFIPFALLFMAVVCLVIQECRFAQARRRLAELERGLIERRDHEERSRILVQHALDARQVTDAKYAELQLRLNTLERTHTLGNLATAIAHDLNNILTTILTNCQAARSQLVTPHPAIAAVEKVEEAVRFARQMVQQIVTAAQDETRPLPPRPPAATPGQSDTPAAPDGANPT